MRMVMVAGVARSGTSMTMGVLNMLGIPGIMFTFGIYGIQDDNVYNVIASFINILCSIFSAFMFARRLFE